MMIFFPFLYTFFFTIINYCQLLSNNLFQTVKVIKILIKWRWDYLYLKKYFKTLNLLNLKKNKKFTQLDTLENTK